VAVLHRTTLAPGKLELLAKWLPDQPWYPGPGRRPELTRAGGFRLDDPAGEVGIEFAVVTDQSAGRVLAYLVPMTYRAQELRGAGGGLIGTARHGVLGDRWIYDGPRDPVLATQLAALVQGQAEPQAQTVSHTPDPTVIGYPATGKAITVTGSPTVTSTESGTELMFVTADAQGAPGRSAASAHQPGAAARCRCRRRTGPTWRLRPVARARRHPGPRNACHRPGNVPRSWPTW
jgi:Maltokinase N-terminal cap domain